MQKWHTHTGTASQVQKSPKKQAQTSLDFHNLIDYHRPVDLARNFELRACWLGDDVCVHRVGRASWNALHEVGLEAFQRFSRAAARSSSISLVLIEVELPPKRMNHRGANPRSIVPRIDWTLCVAFKSSPWIGMSQPCTSVGGEEKPLGWSRPQGAWWVDKAEHRHQDLTSCMLSPPRQWEAGCHPALGGRGHMLQNKNGEYSNCVSSCKNLTINHLGH